jgi:hypothetical protein
MYLLVCSNKIYLKTAVRSPVGRVSPPGVTRRMRGAVKVGDVGLRFANPTYGNAIK